MDRNCYFRSNRQSTLWLLAIVASLPVLVTALLVTRMPPVGEGSEFSSPLHLNLFKASVLIFSGILLYPVLWLSGRYVLAIHKQEHDAAIEVEVWSLFRSKKRYRIPLDRATVVDSVKFHKGSLKLPLKPWVMAPWYTVKLHGYRKWVIDAQGDFPHGEDELADLFTELE